MGGSDVSGGGSAGGPGSIGGGRDGGEYRFGSRGGIGGAALMGFLGQGIGRFAESRKEWETAGKPGTLRDWRQKYKRGRDNQKKGSQISTTPTKNPYQYSLLGDTALASTAAPTLLS